MNLTNIKKEANLYRKNPGNHIWQKVENKLDAGHKHSSGFQLRKVLQYAALFIGFLSITYWLLSTKTGVDRHTTLEFENVNLSTESQQIYAVEKVTALKYAYAKLNMNELSKYRGN